MRTLRNTLFPDLKCLKHGVYDVFPCPWPNCTNGIPENEFQVDAYIEGEDPEIYTRRQWIDLSGSSYYSWDGSRLPNWFSVQKVFWNEARRRNLVPLDTPDLIYHYTSVEGFFGIIDSRQLWLSDYSYLNDTRELSHGADLTAEVATELLLSESHTQSAELLQHWIKDLRAPVHRVCVASFSADRDSLSQWRAYGAIAVGFEPRELSLHAHRATLRPVEYQRNRQRALVELYLHHMREAYLVDLQSGRLERIEDAYHKTDRLVDLITFFKDPAFLAEQEYRLAFIEHPELMPSLGYKCSAKRFRVSRGRIIPYVLSNELEPMVPEGSRQALTIRELVLGPQVDDVLERGVREFLADRGMCEVDVKRSGVPYRT